jgi:hypothetical protein
VKYLYRYVDSDRQAKPFLMEYEIVRETECGYWLKKWGWCCNDELKWVAKSGKNNFAKCTKEAAMENYYHRKERHAAILRSQLRNTENRLRYAEIKTGRKKPEPLLLDFA